MFSILIPTWNNLPYLSKCVEFLKKNSDLPHEIIVYINEGLDGTKDWCRKNKSTSFKYIYSKTNVGIPFALNESVRISSGNIITVFNDDILAMPKWDSELTSFLKQQKFKDDALFGPIPVEPVETPHMKSIFFDAGKTIEEFDEELLLSKLPSLRKSMPNITSYLPPFSISRKRFKEVKGFSTEYSMGIGTDDDFVKKLWNVGVRNFVGVNTSLVYHFKGVTTRKLPNLKALGDERDAVFLRKHGIDINKFIFDVLGKNEPFVKR